MRLCSLFLAIVALAIVGCGDAGGDGSHSFLARASNAAVYLTWTKKGNDVSGSLTQAIWNRSSSYEISPENVSFSGTVSDSGVSLSINQGLGSVRTLTGRLDGDALTLDFPGRDGGITTLHFKPAEPADFNAALRALRSSARAAKEAADRQAAEEQAAQEAATTAEQHAAAVADGITWLLNNTPSPSDPNNRFADDLDNMRNSVAVTKTDYESVLEEVGETDVGIVCGDAETVAGDAETVAGDLDTLKANAKSAGPDTTGVSDAIAQLRQDWAALQNDDPAYVPDDAPTAAGVRRAIRIAKRGAANASNTAGGAVREGKNLLAQARSYAAAARAACQRAGG